MKTSVDMIRPMGRFEVKQRTKDGYFDANGLLLQWNRSPVAGRRKMSEFLESPKTKEFVEAIYDEEVQGSKSDLPDNEVYIKIRGRTSKRGKKAPDRVWMHPYLFIDFAMWLNPKFKYQVIKFVYDQLIAFRHSAGDNFNALAGAIKKFPDVDYIQMSKGLNYIVFGRHQNGIRQIASQDQLHELVDLQNQLAFAVDMGYIKSFSGLIHEMRRIYHQKHPGLIA